MSSDSVVAWLLDNEGPRRFDALIAGLGERLVASGVPVFRCSVSIPTLHPELFVRNVTWTIDGGATTADRDAALLTTPFYLDSPVALIVAGEDVVRCRLEGDGADARFGIVRDMKEAGATDYLALAVPFRDGRRTFVSWTTRRPGGFTDEDVRTLRAIVPVLSLRLELLSEALTLESLLEVYLGQNAARRVLAGAFKRGGGETVRAVVWTCDLRGFTKMADAQPPVKVLATLDRYFETVCAPISAAGGEVLKFIGDAVLAVFPVAGDERAVCERALGSAKEAVASVRAWSATRPDPIRVGVALHLGDVTYGNIGAQRRLDFTVIGPAVNEVCRIEPLCKELGRELLVSDTFAARIGDASLVSLGEYALRGVAEPKLVFGIDGY
jgi:adenylate cyclase